MPATPVALLPEPATPLAAHAAHQGRRPRVLVVDDIEANRCLLEVLLYDGGFHPDLAATGAEAIRLAAAHRYDAILMDL